MEFLKLFKKKNKEHIAITKTRTPLNNTFLGANLTPSECNRILESAVDGDLHDFFSLAEEMEERDPHYSSVLRTRKLAVSGLQVIVEGEEGKALDEIKALIATPHFSSLVDNCLDSLGKGISVNEIIWSTESNRIIPVDYKWRDPHFFTFNKKNPDQVVLINDKDSSKHSELPEHKFIVHTPSLKSGLLSRGGLARFVAFTHVCKFYTLRDWMRFVEVHGMPLRLGKYNSMASKEDIQTLYQAVSHIGSDAAAVLPESMNIEFEQLNHAAGSADVFSRITDYFNREISKAVLGQTASTEGTPGKLGNESIQSEVRQDIIAFDAKQLSNTINRDLVKPYLLINGIQADLTVRFVIPENEDINALSDNLEKLVPLGLKVSMDEVRRKLGLSDPGDEKPLSMAMNSKQTQYNEDSFYNEWESVKQAMVDDVNKAETPESMVEKFNDVVDKVEDKEVEKQLTNASFIARVEGG